MDRVAPRASDPGSAAGAPPGRGPARWLRGAADYLRRRAYLDLTMVLLERGAEVAPPPPPAGLTIVPAADDNLRDLLAFDHPRVVGLFRRFLAAGDVGYLAYLDGRCVHRCWLTPGPATVWPHDLLATPLRAGEGYVHTARTAPSARGRAVLRHVLLRMFADRGPAARFLTAIRADNTPALRGAAKVGFAERERVHDRIVAGLVVRRTTPAQTPRRGRLDLSLVRLLPRSRRG